MWVRATVRSCDVSSTFCIAVCVYLVSNMKGEGRGGEERGGEGRGGKGRGGEGRGGG